MSELLTPEEIYKAKNKASFKKYPWNDYGVTASEVEVAQAQLDKVLKWGDELCTEHEGMGLNGLRRECVECWQRAIVPEEEN